jgi:hypothetical protein
VLGAIANQAAAVTAGGAFAASPDGSGVGSGGAPALHEVVYQHMEGAINAIAVRQRLAPAAWGLAGAGPAGVI